MIGAGDRHPGVLSQHLLMHERLVVATRRHWISLWGPALSVLGAFLLIAWIGTVTPPESREVVDLLWWVWLALVARFIWKVVEWGQEWFAVTDKRLLLTYGVVTRHVAMMPLRKVTDLNYMRVPLGRILGYGTFLFESAGQEQAMREVRFLPDPDYVYQRIGDAVFGVGGLDVDEDGPDPKARERVEVYAQDPYRAETNPVDAFAAADQFEPQTEVWRDAPGSASRGTAEGRGEREESPGGPRPRRPAPERPRVSDPPEPEQVREEHEAETRGGTRRGPGAGTGDPGSKVESAEVESANAESAEVHSGTEDTAAEETGWSVSHESASPYVRVQRPDEDDPDITGPIPRVGPDRPED